MNTFLKYLFVFTIGGLPFIGLAQQEPISTQYMFMGGMINPSYIYFGEYADIGNNLKNVRKHKSENGYFNATLINRNQWIGVNGAPITQLFNFHAPLNNERMAIGASIFYEYYGITSYSNFKVNYSYKIPLSENSILSLGSSAGLVYNKIDVSKLVLTDPVYTDPTFQNAQKVILSPDLGLGISFKYKELRMGLAAQHVLQNRIIKITSLQSDIKSYRQYYFNAAYAFTTVNGLFEFQPNILLNYIPSVSPQANFNCLVYYDKRVWGGAGYRTGDAVSLMIGLFVYNKHKAKHNIIKLGYAYDITVSSLHPYSGGSHELMLSYSFHVNKNFMNADIYK